MSVSEVVTVIQQQVLAQRPELRNTSGRREPNVGQAMFLAVDDRTLRVARKVRGGFNHTDITYDRGRDLYNITRHTVRGHGLSCVTDEPLIGVYADQLGELIH